MAHTSSPSARIGAKSGAAPGFKPPPHSLWKRPFARPNCVERANGVAGELGHIPQWKNTRECGCGNIGCLEPFGGGKRLAELCRTTHPDANIRTIYRDCAGDPDVWGQVDAMAIAVATEVNILDPAYVVLGGGLLQMEGFPIPYFEQKIRAYVRKPYPEQNLRLVYSRPDQENGIIGAAFYGWEQLNRQA